MSKSKTTVKAQGPPESPVQQNIYQVGCTIEAMHASMTKQLADAGVLNPAEVALETIKQGFNNAALSIQIINSIQNKESNLIGFNRGPHGN